MIKYAIFDMDGTLLDTERIFKRSWLVTSEKWGLDGAEELYTNIAGRSGDTIREVFVGKYGEKYNFDEFIADRMDCYVSLASENVPIKPGCFELLDFLREQRIPCALATSTPMYITGKNLERTGIDKYMDVVVTAESVKRGKPAPDIFLEAARRIGAEPRESMVVEDSFNGLRGAHAANMLPVMVIDEQIPDDEIRKLIIAECDSLLDVIDVVKRENSI